MQYTQCKQKREWAGRGAEKKYKNAKKTAIKNSLKKEEKGEKEEIKNEENLDSPGCSKGSESKHDGDNEKLVHPDVLCSTDWWEWDSCSNAKADGTEQTLRMHLIY